MRFCHLNSLGALSLGGRSLFFLCCLCPRFRQHPCSLLCFRGLLSFQRRAHLCGLGCDIFLWQAGPQQA